MYRVRQRIDLYVMRCRQMRLYDSLNILTIPRDRQDTTYSKSASTGPVW